MIDRTDVLALSGGALTLAGLWLLGGLGAVVAGGGALLLTLALATLPGRR